MTKPEDTKIGMNHDKQVDAESASNRPKRSISKAEISFLDVEYELSRAELRLIRDALDTVKPDSRRAANRARYLANMFHRLAERPKP
jgi:hypothetical protein